jgi:beta-mannosidase
VTTIDVTGWELVDRTPGDGDPAVLTDGLGDAALTAPVPGGVHEALIAAGRMRDPRMAGDAAGARWIEDREWWFRAELAAPALVDGERARLVFDALDTVADVWLDGRALGGHRTPFYPAAFDVTELLSGEGDGSVDAGTRHALLVRISPPLPAGAPDGIGLHGGPAARVTGLRKAAFSWGWDFAPRLPAIGIAGPVALRIERGAVLTGHHVALADLAVDRSRATVALRAEAAPDPAAPDAVTTARFTLTTPFGRQLHVEAPVVDGVAIAGLELEEPALWWTHDLGEPARHRVRIELRDADGALLDSRDDLVGLRTIALDRSEEPVEGGRLFRFVLNGMPVFARGANWVPTTPFTGSTDPAVVRDRVRRAREGNLTMLRVWGGGVYEHDAFYDACDEAGVLVWQDLMFACLGYPGEDPAFRAEVEAEARHQVRRLRNRASLALWCGNNEVEVLRLLRPDELGGSTEGDRLLFHELLPAVVAELDPFTPYWPGSPWGEEGAAGQRGAAGLNSVHDGDRHDWEVWHGLTGAPVFTGDGGYPTPGDGRHWRRYADDTGRFVSEFGILSAPDRATLDRWMPGVALHDAVFDAHLTDDPVTKVEELLAVTTGVPADLDEYVALTQAAQAEAMLFAFEHFRRREPRTAGALVWQLIDCWPAMSWALIDVDGRPKAAYWAVRRACAPLAVSLRPADHGDAVEVWLVNSTPRTATVDIDVEVGAFDGAGRRSVRIRGTVASGEPAVVGEVTVPQDARHYAWASSPAGAFPAARRHFAELGELVLGDGRVEATPVDGGLELVAHGYCYGVRIAHPDPLTRLDDDAFDLRDGERRRIRVTGADPAVLAVRTTVPRARGIRPEPIRSAP